MALQEHTGEKYSILLKKRCYKMLQVFLFIKEKLKAYEWQRGFFP